MNVPRLFVLTDRRASAAAGRRLLDTVGRVVAAGAPAVVLREKDLPHAERCRLAADLADVVAGTATRLLVAWTPHGSGADRADGIHLAAADPRPAGDHLAADPRPVGDRRAAAHPPRSVGMGLLGRSCHGPAEVVAAREEGLDYVTVSPFASTASKPGYGPVLGVEGVADLVERAGPLPVVALGGVTPADAPALLGVGVHGLAVMGGVMRADDPARLVTTFLDRTLEVTS